MKMFFEYFFCFFILGLILNFTAYSQSLSKVDFTEGMRIVLESSQKGVLVILPKRGKNFVDGKDIIFVFNNSICSKSVDYLANISWGPEISEYLEIPCGKKEEYFTGYEGGDVKILINIINKNNDVAKMDGGVTVTVNQAARGNMAKRIPWK